MTALVSFERVFEVVDLHLIGGSRTRPPTQDRACPWSLTTSPSPTRGEEVAGLSLKEVAEGVTTRTGHKC